MSLLRYKIGYFILKCNVGLVIEKWYFTKKLLSFVFKSFERRTVICQMFTIYNMFFDKHA